MVSVKKMILLMLFPVLVAALCLLWLAFFPKPNGIRM